MRVVDRSFRQEVGDLLTLRHCSQYLSPAKRLAQTIEKIRGGNLHPSIEAGQFGSQNSTVIGPIQKREHDSEAQQLRQFSGKGGAWVMFLDCLCILD